MGLQGLNLGLGLRTYSREQIIIEGIGYIFKLEQLNKSWVMHSPYQKYRSTLEMNIQYVKHNPRKMVVFSGMTVKQSFFYPITTYEVETEAGFKRSLKKTGNNNNSNNNNNNNNNNNSNSSNINLFICICLQIINTLG